MNLKHITRLAIAALFVAWCFDQLFWQQTPGLSFFLFTLACLGAEVYLTWGEGLKPARSALVLVPLVLFFAGMTFFRQEPFTLFMDYSLALLCMFVLVMTWLGGRWWQYSLSDYVVNGARLAVYSFAQPVRTYSKPAQEARSLAADMGGPGPAIQPNARSKRGAIAVSLALGLGMALPIVALLAVLLANADPIFNRRVEEFIRLLNLQNLDEMIVRLVYICMLAYVLCGCYLFALIYSRQEKLVGLDKPWLPPFLGWIEAATVLACVDLLFASFVIVQFKYFFGGQANIHLEGFTYADYARRGFGELVAVAVISLLLFLSLSMLTRRAERRSRRIFSTLGIALVGLVSVILVSAFQRLLLYESAYGFSRLRAYTHVFMVWLGVLLVVTALLEGLGRLRYFALAAVLTCLGFGITLNILNVDAYITNQNIARATWGLSLDVSYLNSLSADAVPALFDGLHSARLPAEQRNEVGAALACRNATQPGSMPEASQPWPSYQWSREQAKRMYSAYENELQAFPLKLIDRSWSVWVNGAWKGCTPLYRD